MTIRDPFQLSNKTVYGLTCASTMIMFIVSALEAFYFKTMHEEAEWIVMASYGVTLFFLTVGRSWHIYGNKMTKPQQNIVVENKNYENVTKGE